MRYRKSWMWTLPRHTRNAFGTVDEALHVELCQHLLVQSRVKACEVMLMLCYRLLKRQPQQELRTDRGHLRRQAAESL